MSFSLDVKNELLRKTVANDCCAYSELSAVIQTGGSLGISGGGISLSLSTENPLFARHIFSMIKSLFGADIELSAIKPKRLYRHNIYSLEIAPQYAESILSECGIVFFQEGYRQIRQGIDSYLLENDCCKKSFVRGCFLGCGTITVQKRYHLELVFNNMQLAQDFLGLAALFDFKFKLSTRKDKFVVYLKISETISDFLAFVGAYNAVNVLQSYKIGKDIRNNANRQNNCTTANIDKAIAAAESQTEYIEYIKKNIGLDKLPDELKEICLYRLENPDSNTEEIARAFPPLTKSGVYHRLTRIKKIAENHKNGERND